MIKFFSNLDWNTKEKKEIPKVARDLFVRLFQNDTMEENEAEYYQRLVKRTKTEELNHILLKHFCIDSTSTQIQNILTLIKKETMFFEATEECPKALKRLKTA